jgi:hypothetical protein
MYNSILVLHLKGDVKTAFLHKIKYLRVADPVVSQVKIGRSVLDFRFTKLEHPGISDLLTLFPGRMIKA